MKTLPYIETTNRNLIENFSPMTGYGNKQQLAVNWGFGYSNLTGSTADLDGTWKDSYSGTIVHITNGMLLDHPLRLNIPVEYLGDGNFKVNFDNTGCCTGSLTDEGLKIEWSNGAVWQRQIENAPTTQSTFTYIDLYIKVRNQDRLNYNNQLSSTKTLLDHAIAELNKANSLPIATTDQQAYANNQIKASALNTVNVIKAKYNGIRSSIIHVEEDIRNAAATKLAKDNALNPAVTSDGSLPPGPTGNKHEKDLIEAGTATFNPNPVVPSTVVPPPIDDAYVAARGSGVLGFYIDHKMPILITGGILVLGAAFLLFRGHKVINNINK